MFKKIVFISLTTLFYSCGKQSNSHSGSTPPSNSSIFANAGPSACNLGNSSISSGEIISPYYANFQEVLSSPFKIKALQQRTHAPIIRQEKQQNRNLQIVGGDTVAATTNCQSATNSPSAKTIASKNTVAIVFPASGLVGSGGSDEICSGALVGDGNGNYLVLTAAHCFNSMANYSDTTAGGAKIYFDDTVFSSNYSSVSCWQRSPYYHDTPVTNSDFSTSLFDVAWMKLSTPSKISSTSYVAAKVLTSTSLTASSEKLMVGFGATSDGSAFSAPGSDGNKRCISTSADASYSARGGDITPSGKTSIYNQIASSILGSRIANFTTSAYETYLTVIGPINGQSSADVSSAVNSSGGRYNYPSGSVFGGVSGGTCFGDSGGPVYIYNGGEWILAALTEGADNLITPHPIVKFAGISSPVGLNSASSFNTGYAGLCKDGYGIYTTLANHVSWIQSSSGVTLTKQ